MILDKQLTEKKLNEEINLIENSVLKSEVVDDSTKKLVANFPSEFKDLILEAVLKQIVNDPAMKAKFQEELKRNDN